MPIELSHGRARPTLPRASDLQPVTVSDAERGRFGERDERGRFANGNRTGRGRGWKRAIASMLGKDVDDPVAQRVAADAWRVFAATVRELPSDGASVRALAASRARHVALESFWHAHAVTIGLTSPEGVKAQEMASKHGQRAERLAVTALDVATRLVKRGADDESWAAEVRRMDAQAEADLQRKRETERRARDDAAREQSPDPDDES